MEEEDGAATWPASAAEYSQPRFNFQGPSSAVPRFGPPKSHGDDQSQPSRELRRPNRDGVTHPSRSPKALTIEELNVGCLSVLSGYSDCSRNRRRVSLSIVATPFPVPRSSVPVPACGTLSDWNLESGIRSPNVSEWRRVPSLLLQPVVADEDTLLTEESGRG